MTVDATIRWLDLAALMAEPPPPVPWVVEPLLARGHVTMLAGAPGVGKSLLAVAIASAVAHQADAIAGMAVAGGDVVLVDAENGERLLHERAHLVDLPTGHVRAGLATGFDLRRPQAADELRPALEDAALLVLDSLASLAPGLKENDADQAGPVLDRIRGLAHDTGVAILLLHHTRKGGDAYRGGTALPGAVDVLAVYTREPGHDDRERRVIDWRPERGGKMRLGAEPDPRWLRVRVHAGQLTIDAADPPAAPDDEAAPTKRDTLREHAVSLVAEHGPMRQGDLLAALHLDRTDRTGRRALQQAVDAGQLTREGNGPYHFPDHDMAGTLPLAPATGGGRVALPPTGESDQPGATPTASNGHQATREHA